MSTGTRRKGHLRLVAAVAAVGLGTVALNETGGLPGTDTDERDGCRRQVTFTVNWAFGRTVANQITWGVKNAALRENGIPTPFQRRTNVPCDTEVELHVKFIRRDPGALMCAITANNVVHEPDQILRDARGTSCSVTAKVTRGGTI